jgi:hypothetical protein
MKLYYFKLAKSNILPFIRFCEGLDIVILISWIEEGDIFNHDNIVGYIRVYPSTTIPEELQLEKLNEKYGNVIKSV